MSLEESNATLFKVVRELQSNSQDLGIDFALRGGLAVHILRSSVGDEPEDWKHKDIDVALPLSQMPRFIGLLKSLGYVKSPLSPREGDRYVYQNLVQGKRISLDILGVQSFTTVEIEYVGHAYRVLPPDIELEFMKAKLVESGNNPKVDRSVKFLENYLKSHVDKKGGACKKQ